MTYELVATCLFGCEKFLGEEIDSLGYKRIETLDGRVVFLGNDDAIARCNVNLRCAERVFVRVGSFVAKSFEELFEGTRALEWEAYIPKDAAFPVKGHSIKSDLFSIPDCQAIIKKSVAKRLGEKYSVSWLPESGVTYQIEFFILKNQVSLMIDTSGIALHKRGYRPVSNSAPLRETLAAVMAKIARVREDVLFWDPMCGSGTIPIEAAMLAMNIAPGVSRSFAAQNYSFVDLSSWSKASEEAMDLVVRNSTFEAYASDISDVCVEITKANCKRAGVVGHVKAFKRDALEITTSGRKGTVVCNPPYGERLMTLREAEELYSKMGRHFKTLDSWQIYILTSDENFERCYGRRADKVRKLYNGMIKCNLYQYFKNFK